jgi:serine protease
MIRMTLLLALGATLGGAAAAASGPVTGFIVQLKESAAETAPQRRQRLSAVVDERGWPLQLGAVVSGHWQRLAAPAVLNERDAAALEAQLRADPRVAAVVPDVREQRLAVTPNDARFAEQWWLQTRTSAIGRTGVADLATAWVRSTGAPVSGPVAPVAVLDSGITSHPELNARALPGFDFVADGVYSRDGNGRDNDPADPGDAVSAADRAANPAAFTNCPEQPLSSWHGSIIAGQVAALSNNGEGTAAANWNGTFVPVRVAGQCGAAVSDLIDGMKWAAGLAVPGVPANPNPARLIVLSYGSRNSCDANSSDPAIRDTARLYQDALAEVRAQGAVVFAAAGNERVAVGRPANCNGAFAVASLNREGFKATYSNYGPEVQLATPGGDDSTGGTCDLQLADGGIVSTGNLGDVNPGAAGYAAASGTSFAAPVVAATAAMMLALNPNLTLAQIEAGLKLTAHPFVQVPLLGNCAANDNPGRCTCTATSCGAGMLDADQALAYAAAPDTYAAPARSAFTLRDSRIEACATLLGRPVPPVEPPVDPPPAKSGGGAMSGGWLLALLGATLALVRLRSGNGTQQGPRS